MKYTKLETKDDHYHYDNDNNGTLMTTEETSSFDDDDDNDDIGDVELISSTATYVLKTTSTSTTTKEEEEELQLQRKQKQKQNDHHLQLYRIYNLAIPLCYFMVGLTQGIIYPLLNVYPLDLGATEAQQQTIWFLKGLPSCLKIIFGFISDNYPIMGYRRKPYMYIGWIISMISLLILLCLSDLSLSQQTITIDASDDCNNESSSFDDFSNNTTTTTTAASCIKEVRVPSSFSDGEEDNAIITGIGEPPSIPLLSLVFFIWATGVWLADVIGDTLVAEKSKYETNDNRGNLQTSCYLLRGLGIAIMTPISTLMYNNRNGPFYIILIATILPLGSMPFIYQLKEKRIDDDGDGNHESIIPTTTTKENLIELWKTACSKAVYQPIGFVYLYVSLYVTNAAWKEFLKSVLGFTPNQLNILLFVGGFLVLIGLIVYKFCLLKWSWRTLFVIGIILNGIFSFGQILLITNNIPFGLNPFWFSLGDDCVKDFIIGTQYLPMCIMMVNLVPTGIEGMSYALFTTTFNSASAVSDAISTILLRIWDVSKSTLIDGQLNGLIKLTILTTIIQIIPLLFIQLMPHNVDDINRLKQQSESSNSSSTTKIGGYIYLSIVFLSVVFAIFIGIMNIIDPGWMGES